jgi:uncharacterized protein
VISLELELWQRIAALQQSVSHDFHHIRRVQRYAEELRKVYGGDHEVLTAAAILHDLGRGDQSRRHGLESIEASKAFALAVLRFIDIGAEKKEMILHAIETHDQPDLRPELLEAQILKDADFLAGFGAWGILRIAMWSGETGRRVEEVVAKIGEGMRRRFDGLEFELSRAIAHRELLVAQLFLAELSTQYRTPPRSSEGTYVVIEGISGSGKNTIAEQVKMALADTGVNALIVEEPSENFRNLRNAIPPGQVEFSAPPLARALFMADRYLLMEQKIKPALRNSELVVSVRSYLSTAVYQSATDTDAYSIMLAYGWVPTCDLLIVLDLEVQAALERIRLRAKPSGDFETEEDLSIHRPRYLRYASAFNAKRYRLIDAQRTKEAVATDALTAIRECYPCKPTSPELKN